MAIEDILKQIGEETESRAGEILGHAGEEAAAIEKQYDGRAGRLERKLGEQAKRKASEEEKRIIVGEQLELRKDVLTKKREILEELYEAAAARIRRLPDGDYLELMRSLIARRAISGREEIVVPSGQRELFGDDFLRSLNERFGSGARFTLSKEKGAFEWGVVLREQRRTVDLTLDVLLEQLKEKAEHRIAATLFAEK